jgi:hypothetical protein
MYIRMYIPYMYVYICRRQAQVLELLRTCIREREPLNMLFQMFSITGEASKQAALAPTKTRRVLSRALTEP